MINVHRNPKKYTIAVLFCQVTMRVKCCARTLLYQ